MQREETRTFFEIAKTAGLDTGALSMTLRGASLDMKKKELCIEVEAAQKEDKTACDAMRAAVEEAIPGVEEICPSNASYMVRVDPDRLHPRDLVRELQRVVRAVRLVRQQDGAEGIHEADQQRRDEGALDRADAPDDDHD